MKSKIFFANPRVKGYDYKYSFIAKFEQILDEIDFKDIVDEGEYIAIKTHFGSYGAHRIVRPFFIRKVVDKVKSVGGKPFVTDTVRIPGLEYLEVANTEGINHLSVGAPVILADGIFGRDHIPVESGPILGKIGVASAIYYAPSMIVVSHCKGHVSSGFGGAIKNLGMGGISCKNHCGNAERGKIHVKEKMPIKWHKEKCTRCYQCVDVCPHDSIYFEKDELIIIDDRCVKCARCTRVCEQEALIAPISNEDFQRGFAEAANAVISTFEENRILYINFITEVQPECDCMPMADTPVVQDLGVLVSFDPVAIDQASIDLINSAHPLPDSKAEDKNVKKGDNILKAVTGKDAQIHIDAACELGLGSKQYEFIKIDEKDIPEGQEG